MYVGIRQISRRVLFYAQKIVCNKRKATEGRDDNYIFYHKTKYRREVAYVIKIINNYIML